MLLRFCAYAWCVIGVVSAVSSAPLSSPRRLKGRGEDRSGRAHFAALLPTDAQDLGDDVEIVRQRLLSLQLWPSPDSIASVVAEAKGYQSALNSSCYWPDIDYYNQDRAMWTTIDHLSRVQIMAQALTAPYSSVVNNSALNASTVCALNVWLTRAFTNPNWWYQVIGVPIDISGIFVMLGVDRLTPLQVQQGVDLMFEAAWWSLPYGYASGANLVWELQVQIARGASTNNVSAIVEGFARAWQEVAVVNFSSQGIQTDMSYHFHGQQLQTGSYGASSAISLLQFWQLANGTTFDASQDVKNLIAAWLADGDAWMSIRNIWDFSVVGRAVARINGMGIDADDQAGLIQQLAPYTNRTADLLAYGARILGLPGVPLLQGNRHYYNSDYMVHRRVGWSATLRMHSARLIATECDNSENLKGEHLADGALNIYAPDDNDRSGKEYDNIFPLWDWNAINGITVEHSTPILPCGAETGWTFQVRNTTFVGGVSDGSIGATAMDTATHNLTAHRTWFFFDEVIVGLATNITDPTDADIWTTMVSRYLFGNVSLVYANGRIQPLADGNYTLATSDVLAIFADGMAYAPCFASAAGACPSQVYLSAGNRVGTWQSIGADFGTESGRVLQVSLLHGTNPKNAQYAYAILPNVTLPSVAYQLLSSNVSVIAQGGVHAVANVTQQRVQAVFWEPGDFRTCQSGAPCGWDVAVASSAAALIIVTEDANGNVTVSASNPDQPGLQMQVTVNRALKGRGCTGAGSSTTFSFTFPATPELQGSTSTLSCEPA